MRPAASTAALPQASTGAERAPSASGEELGRRAPDSARPMHLQDATFTGP
jgi:hypothetical protein